MKNIEEDGIWFLPSNVDKQVYGKLTFSNNHLPTLYLIDQLQEFQEISSGHFVKSLEFNIINGILVDGREVTLCHCVQEVQFKTGIQTSKIYASHLLIGHHFQSLDDILFRGVSVRYKNLEEWIGLSNIEMKASTENEQEKIKEINIKQTINEPIKFGSLLGFSLFVIDISANLTKFQLISLFRQVGQKITLQERRSLVIKSDEDKSLNELIKVISLFRDLLTFASGQIIYPYDIESVIITKKREHVFPDAVKFALSSGFGIEHLIPITIEEVELEKEVHIEIYFQTVESLDKLESEFDSSKVLFNFIDVKDQLEIILAKWEQSSESLQPIIDLYLRLIYIPKRHINDFFLSIAQAIEAFHSLSHSGTYIEKCVYKKYIQKTLNESIRSIPDYVLNTKDNSQIDLKELKKILLEEKLSHLNSYSLKDRLKEILEESRSALPDNIFQSLEQEETFLKQVRKTRNYLTHLSDKNKKDVVFGNELLILSRKLKILLEICLLKKLGISDLAIKNSLAKTCNFNFWL